MRTVYFRSLSLVAAVLTLTASVAAQDRPSGLLNNEHVTLAQTYRGTRIAQAAVHHDRLAGLSRDGAKEATAAAEMHKQLAGVGR